jgi:hypothetical protein
MIKINSKAKILNGKYANWDIIIEHDSESTAGYYVLISNPSDSEGYDNWFEEIEEVERYIASERWAIEWI